MRILAKKMRSGNHEPTLFSVVQLLGAECHRRIMAKQARAADAILAEPTWGSRIKALKKKEEIENMTQKVATSTAPTLASICTADAFVFLSVVGCAPIL